MPDLTRIKLDRKAVGGKPYMRGLRVTVGTIVGLLASGRTPDEILAGYPYLEGDDILAALVWAAWRSEEIEIPPPFNEDPHRSEPAASLVRFPLERVAGLTTTQHEPPAGCDLGTPRSAFGRGLRGASFCTRSARGAIFSL